MSDKHRKPTVAAEMTSEQAAARVRDICFAYESSRLTEARDEQLHPAHYTTAENALNILSGGSLWLRNAAVMNDFMEIEHGARCLDNVLASDAGKALITVVDMAHPGLMSEVLAWLKMGESLTRAHTYMTSFSEHEEADRLGRLSMWRAYGGPTAGVALVFDREASIDDGEQQQAFFSPVFYGGVIELGEEIGRRADILRANLKALTRASRAEVLDILKRALYFAILSIKHPGFQEEREWRAIWTPAVVAHHQAGSIRSVRGIPQRVLELRLFQGDTPFERATNVTRLGRQVIIGPCQYPEVIRAAFTGLLAEIGLGDSDLKVVVSGIPLRQMG